MASRSSNCPIFVKSWMDAIVPLDQEFLRCVLDTSELRGHLEILAMVFYTVMVCSHILAV